MCSLQKHIKLTTPSFPPKQQFYDLIASIEASGCLTNSGDINRNFELNLCKYLGTKHLSLMSSGTMALTLAIKALNISGEIICTAFTSPATIMACHWNGLSPVFADIVPETCNLSPNAVEKLITTKTSAILAVHVYSHPCEIEQFELLSKKYGLKLIYDASHCFGANYKKKSLCCFGDISIVSFHATKVFNTAEGGAVICNDVGTKKRLDILKNTGIDQEHNIVEFGLNAKMSELHAAFGMALLPQIDNIIRKRKLAYNYYQELLSGVKGLKILVADKQYESNYAYLPIVINANEFGCSASKLFLELKKYNISSRRYFYPLISDTKLFANCKKDSLLNAKKLSDSILCLPLFETINKGDLAKICEVILKDF